MSLIEVEKSTIEPKEKF